jgi:hypothetical protein
MSEAVILNEPHNAFTDIKLNDVLFPRTVSERNIYLTLEQTKQYVSDINFRTDVNRATIVSSAQVKLSVSNIDGFIETFIRTISEHPEMIGSVTLSGYNESDISFASQAHEVILKNCPNVMSTKSLVNVKHIQIVNCPKITDFTSLDNATKIKIVAEDEHVIDLKQFPSVQELFLKSCRITNLVCCHNITVLHLENCSNVLTIPLLPRLQEVDITHSYFDGDITNLSHVSDVTIVGCSTLINVSPLTNIMSVALIECNSIRDISPLRNNFEVIIKCCNSITNIDTLSDVLNVSVSPNLKRGTSDTSYDSL